MAEPQPADTDDKDLPLREDIRRLGRILGDTLRQQGGDAVFDTVETIRQNAVRFHRDEDVEARHALEETLNRLPPGDALQLIRAFGFFSHPAVMAGLDPAIHGQTAQPLPLSVDARTKSGHDEWGCDNTWPKPL